MYPAKTRLSLGIRPVWSESSLWHQWVAKEPNFLHAGSEDSDQTGRMPRMSRVFAGRTCHFVGFVIMWQLQIFYPPPPPPPPQVTTDRSKAVVPVLFLFCVALWFILQHASCFKVFPSSLSSCFVLLFDIVITSLGEEGAGLCASRAFVCLLCTC